MANFDILFLAAYSCAGKTTLGEAFCRDKGVRRVYQQSIYRKIAVEKGYSSAREWLMTVGKDEFINETTKATIDYLHTIKPEGTILIDETYNLSEVEQFKKEFPKSKIIIIAVTVDREVRSSRMVERLGQAITKARKELDFRDTFLQEVGLDEVLKTADIEIDNTGTIEQSIEQMVSKLELLGISL